MYTSLENVTLSPLLVRLLQMVLLRISLEVEHVVRARDLKVDNQYDLIISLLRGSALEEVHLRTGGEHGHTSS